MAVRRFPPDIAGKNAANAMGDPSLPGLFAASCNLSKLLKVAVGV